MRKLIPYVLNLVWSVLTSKRFKAFYWSSANMIFAGFLDLILQEFVAWDADNLLTVGVGLAFAQVTKALNNYVSKKK